MSIHFANVPDAKRPLCSFLVLAGAVTLALVSARDYAGGWNDGSRLATVECLVDYHTLAIDQSIFVKVPAHDGTAPTPYRADDANLMEHGTGDKSIYPRPFLFGQVTGAGSADGRTIPGLAVVHRDNRAGTT